VRYRPDTRKVCAFTLAFSALEQREGLTALANDKSLATWDRNGHKIHGQGNSTPISLMLEAALLSSDRIISRVICRAFERAWFAGFTSCSSGPCRWHFLSTFVTSQRVHPSLRLSHTDSWVECSNNICLSGTRPRPSRSIHVSHDQTTLHMAYHARL
jgi:hypothetical protein